MARQRRELPLSPPPPPVGSDIDIESFWGTSIGEQDVDLDDGPATMFKVPEPPPLPVQEASEKLAIVIKNACENLEDRVHDLNRTLRLIWYSFLFGAVIALLYAALVH